MVWLVKNKDSTPQPTLWVMKHAPLVIDTRNVTKNMKQWKKKIVKA
ncbi:MAG: hypothetical protein MUP27_03810 [Desulfobacterales bacterium]|nr:hypothetical protein [Desulfobacterales bacterium]